MNNEAERESEEHLTIVHCKAGLVARIIPEDQPVLDVFQGKENFCLICKEDI